MPRRAFWPAGPVDRSDIDELRASRCARRGRRGGRDRAGADAAMSRRGGGRPGQAGSPLGAPPTTVGHPRPREVLEATRRGRGPTRPTRGGRRPIGDASRRRVRAERRVKGQLDPATELARAREELEREAGSGVPAPRPRAAPRSDATRRPCSTPCTCDASPRAALVRGDAQRLLGRHLEAEAAFDAAAESLEVS